LSFIAQWGMQVLRLSPLSSSPLLIAARAPGAGSELYHFLRQTGNKATS
jgi:hypothetical protein